HGGGRGAGPRGRRALRGIGGRLSRRHPRARGGRLRAARDLHLGRRARFPDGGPQRLAAVAGAGGHGGDPPRVAALAARRPGGGGAVVCAILRAWRPAALAGLMGAIASQLWFLAFALEAAARVRTLALVEILFAQVVSARIFRQRTRPREALGLALVVVGVLVLLAYS